MKKFLFILVIANYLIVISSAQEAEEELINSPAQVTFFYPLGTNSIHTHKYYYDISLNILAGRTGGVNGFELAGWVNLNDKFISFFNRFF